jgi:hypothetical protein
MSLATLARKTKAKQRLRTRGKFILNMTGRGNVLGMNAKMSRGNCKGLTKCAGKRAACCVGVGGSDCCEFPHGGQPAPQMGYRVYLNRKSKGAYRPAGGKQCKTLAGCTNAKTVWKQGSNLDASVVTTNRRDNILACNSDVYTAPTDCSKRCCCDCKSICGCRSTDVLRYTRINKSFGCQTTKAVRMGRSASEQIARNRAAVDCIAPKHRSIYLTIDTAGNISFDGCCGNQCLIQGQQYTFQIKNNDTSLITFRILWCQQVPGTDIGIFDEVSVPQNSTVNASFTVPKFNNKSSCNMPDKALLGTKQNSAVNLSLDYCKQAYKRPQMLGSCSGR